MKMEKNIYIRGLGTLKKYKKQMYIGYRRQKKAAECEFYTEVKRKNPSLEDF